MSNSIQENAVEQIAVNPGQTAQLVKNENKFPSTADVNVAVFDSNVVTKKMTKPLDDLEDWKNVLHDPIGTLESGDEKYQKYRPVVSLSRDPVWYSLAQQYGVDLARKSDIMLEYNRPSASTALGRLVDAYNYSQDTLRLSSARKELSDARMAGNAKQQAELENEIADLKYKLETRDKPFESEGWNAFTSVAASSVRTLPEMIGIELGKWGVRAAATAAIPVTGGVSMIAAGAAEVAAPIARAAVIYNDTYNVEYGSMLQQVMESNPNAGEEEVRHKVHTGAQASALIESLPALIPGLDISGFVPRVAGRVTKGVAYESLASLAKRDPAAARAVLLKGAQLLGSMGIEIGSETIQEVLQEMVGRSTVTAATEGGDVLELSEEALSSFIRNPDAPENQYVWDTLRATGQGVGIWEVITRALTGGAGAASTAVRHRRGAQATTNDKGNGAIDNLQTAERLFNERQNSVAAKESPEFVRRGNEAMVASKIAPEKVYIDKQMVEQIMAEEGMDKAVRDLELQNALADSVNNGGVVEVDFSRYDDVVNTDEALYQKIRGAVSFDPSKLSFNQFQAYVESLDAKSVNEIEKARATTDSVYNKWYTLLKKRGVDDMQAQAEAMTAQLMANRVGAFRLGNVVSGEEVATRLEVRPAVAQQQSQEAGATPVEQDRVLYQFLGGEAVEEQNLGQQRDESIRRVEAGEDPEVVRQETGFYQEADGSWVFEISDADMQSNRDSKYIDASTGGLGTLGTTTLGEIIDAPTLFKYVPWIQDLEVIIKESKGGAYGEANSKTIWLYRSKLNTEDKMLDTLVHEIQHVLQRHYQFMQSKSGKKPKGGKRNFVYNPIEYARAVLDKDSVVNRLRESATKLGEKVKLLAPDIGFGLPADSLDVRREMYGRRGQLQEWAEQGLLDKEDVSNFITLYQEAGTLATPSDYSLSGWEYMARNTEIRRRLTEEQRKTITPAQTRDIEGGVWVINTQGGNANYRPAALPGNSSFQGGPVGISSTGGKIAGMFYREGDKFIIALTPNANPTTLTHELFHWFSAEMQEAYNSGQMTEYWKSKTELLAKTVGAEIVDGKLSLTDTQEDKAANMFLLYIKEGKVDNRALSPLFAYMQVLFRRIWYSLKLRVSLSKESEELFDSIFRAQDAAQDEQRLAGILEIEKPEGADQGLYDMYVGEMLNSRIRSTNDLRKKWIKIEEFRKSNRYQEIETIERTNIAESLNQDVNYIVMDVAAKHDMNPQATWAALMANDATADLDLTPDQVAEIIQTTPNKQSVIDERVKARMDEYIQQAYKITPEEMGLRASRNSSKVKALLAESLMRDGKTAADFEQAYSDLLSAADAQVAKSSLKRLANKEYWNTLESRAVERYAFALGAKDNKEMSEARRDQAIVNAIRMRAEAITNRATRFQETAEEMRGAQKKVPLLDTLKGKRTLQHRYGAIDYDLMQSILENFGFDISYARRISQPVAEKMDKWIDEQESTTLTTLGVMKNFIPFIRDGHKGSFSSMTGADFDKLEAVFNAIKSTAATKYFIVKQNERILLLGLTQDTVSKFKDMNIEGFEDKKNWWSQSFGVLGSWTNPEPIIREIFPESVLDNVWLPFIDAAVIAENRGRSWVESFRAAKSQIDASNKRNLYTGGTAVAPRTYSLTNQQVADLLLSMGNQHAYDNYLITLADKVGVPTSTLAEDAEGIISQALKLQPGLADFAQTVWGIYDKASAQLDKEFQQRTNTLFVKKEHREFTINGIKFGGGYVPVRKIVDHLPTEMAAANVGGMVGDKRFEKMVVDEAGGEMRSIIDITENELFQSAKQGFSANEYNNAYKYLQQVKHTIGDGAYRFLDDWMTTYKSPKYDTAAWIRPLASMTSVAALGFRASTALLQLSGLGPAATSLGPKYWSRGIVMAMKNGEWAPFVATRKGARKSDYMESRIGDPRSSLLGQSIIDAVRKQNANTQLGKVSKTIVSKTGDVAMSWIQYVDTIVANITWNGAYLRALDTGKSTAEAKREADSVVRVVQSDSLQISRSAAMQNPLARILTAFATWIMAMQSQMRAFFGTRQYAKMASFGVMYMVLSPLLESFLKESIKPEFDEDKDKDYVERILNAWYNEMVGTLGTSFIPALNLGGMATTSIAAGLEEGIMGEREIFKTRTSNTPVVQTGYRAANTVRYGLAAAWSGDEEKAEKALIYGTQTFSTELGKWVKYLLAE